MRIIIPPSVVAVDDTRQPALLNRFTKQALLIDVRQLAMWRALQQHATVEQAFLALEKAASSGSPLTTQDDVYTFVNQLASHHMVGVVAEGLVGRAYRSARRNGVRHVLAAATALLGRRLDAWIDGRFDRRYGTETVDVVLRHELGASQGLTEAHPFVAIPFKTFRRVLAEAVPAAEGFVFIDFGSGKGRTLLLASDAPFRKIIGVEVSPVVHGIAERNIQIYRNRRQRCHDTVSVLADAADFALPSGDLVLYFWTPFDGRTLDAVLQRITAALEAGQRRIVLLVCSESREFIEAFLRLPVALACEELWLSGMPKERGHVRLFKLTNEEPRSM